jgi:hypothetical protein
MRTRTHGGRRAGAGRKSLYPGKNLDAQIGIDFTPEGRATFDAVRDRTGASGSDILAHLVRRHAIELRELADVDGVVWPGKSGDVVTIRLPPPERRQLRDAHAHTGKSYSDLGETLVRRYGRSHAREIAALARSIA